MRVSRLSKSSNSSQPPTDHQPDKRIDQQIIHTSVLEFVDNHHDPSTTAKKALIDANHKPIKTTQVEAIHTSPKMSEQANQNQSGFCSTEDTHASGSEHCRSVIQDM